MKYIITLLISLLFHSAMMAQETKKVVLVGYIYEVNNRGYLNEVKVKIESEDKRQSFETVTDVQGKFEVKIPITGGIYNIEASKVAFKKASVKISTKGRQNNEGVFAKVEMSRLPGYLLEMSLTDMVDPNDLSAPAYGVADAHIEIYNNTLQKEVVNIAKHPSHMIQCNLEQGNEYIFLIRKEGYYTKRMRANVNVNGCILCMEGFGTVTPRVADNLTKENSMGSLGTDVLMKKMVLNETMKIENIYYDLGKSTLRPEAYVQLDNVTKLLLDNPQIVIELASHTDSRGSNPANMDLSQRRANSVVQYIKSRATIKEGRIEAKGYGETQPINSCVDGVPCSEEMYQKNRRTEITVVDILAEKPGNAQSLSSMMQERNFDLILDANNSAYAGSTERTELYHRETPSKPQTMAIDYSGYKIQMMEKKGNLSTNHFMFYEFDQVFLDLLKEQHYAFLIGDYKDLNQANTILNQYKTQFPEAKVIEYKDGRALR